MSGLDFFHRANAEYLERLHAQFERDPQSLSAEWRAFFAGFEAGGGRAISPPAAAQSAPQSMSPQRPAGPQVGTAHPTPQPVSYLSEGVYDLVHSYRELGHCIARLDPLVGLTRPPHPLLDLSQFGLSEADLDREIGPGSFLGPPAKTLGELVAQLQATYCGTLGVEYMDITSKEQRTWLQERMEPSLNRPELSATQSQRLLELLVTAETFEKFLNTRFVGQKRFSIEGAEALIPLLDTLIEEGAALGIQEAVIGMAHRGRLNVLAHTVHKPYEIILSEFLGTTTPQTPEGDGDVKYHLGYSHDRMTVQGHKIHCSLGFNPSHLELVDPVIEGVVRAKQDHRQDRDRSRVVPILLHGEAAFTGQGIVAETLGLSELPAYRTGGTIHVIVNNQVGFTATPEQTRFTPYPTDVAKMIQAPIFHVNGDDPEMVAHAARLAIAFRQQFHVDVMLDLWCYRRHGHNETDDPTFTQPLMYREIERHRPVAEIYAERLVRAGKIDAGEPKRLEAKAKQQLDLALTTAKELHPRQRIFALGGLWKGLTRAGSDWSCATAIREKVLCQVTEAALSLPGDFTPHPKLKRLLHAREKMAVGEQAVDWGCAEMWALGSLLLEGTAVRLTGQDVERGTFSHRHAVLHDFERGTRHVPLQHLADGQGSFTIVNTILSEMGVLGFEYGFSSADPHTLVIWEAQFGDFINGAQPVIDQFIAAAEAKWQRMSGIVLLLPHGFEGQGPEHSSARLERFLQLCAENNLQVVNPTQAAQYFHLLRRQMRRTFRKPLIVMSPKSLLRDERAGSRLEDFTSGTFRLVIDDPAEPPPDQVRQLLLCSGRIFFTLQTAREELATEGISLARVEQLYPFPRSELAALLARYRRVDEVAWVQEEPRNMGAWSFIEPRLRELLPVGCPLVYHGRDEDASPATGSFRLHQAEERVLIRQVLGSGTIAPPATPPAPVEHSQSDGSAVSRK